MPQRGRTGDVERSDDLQPWLRGLTQQDLAQIAVDLTYTICRPSFGSLSKRELEQLTFQLLYDHRGTDWSTLGEIADDLSHSMRRGSEGNSSACVVSQAKPLAGTPPAYGHLSRRSWCRCPLTPAR
jgi:hypothetical protein